jgi:agmatinase
MLENTRIVDCGDVDIAYYGIDRNMPLITQGVKVLLARKALPVLLGGDHSVSFPIVQVFEDLAPLDIVHVDSHLDFIDDVEGLKLRAAALCGARAS